MRKGLYFFFALILAVALQNANFAKAETVSAKNPEKIMEIAKGYGSATLGKDRDGDPLITGRINGVKYGIYFFGCSKNKDCDSIQFSAGWSMQDKPSWDKINEWNRGKRFGKAFLDSEGDPRLEMDFPLPEVSTSYLEIFFSWWQIALKQFIAQMD